MKSKKQRITAFTLVELLVAITILGLILIMVVPQVISIKNNNKETKYKKYAETLLTSGKLYTDSYSEDMFGNNTSGCYDISYDELKKKNLLKDIKVNNIDCSKNSKTVTYVRVRKSGDHYTYEYAIGCKDKNGDVYTEKLPANACDGDRPDEIGPTITISPNGMNWTKGSGKKVKIIISDVYGMLENTKVKYAWTTTPSNTSSLSYTHYDFKNKRYQGTTSSPLEVTVDVPQGKTGIYYLVVTPIDVRDANGNYQASTTTSSAFKLDNTGPTCASNTGSTAWTASNRTITVQCTDSHSGCAKASYSKSYSRGTVKTDSLIISDNVGNTTSCSYNVYVDKDAPTTPTSGSIGSVSGSNTTGSIQTAASGSTDTGSGVKEYRYVIKNSSSTPSKSEFTSTSRTFIRSCGTSYYAWAAAVDNVGNVSNIKYLGSTYDNKNEFSDWTACSSKCDGGTQTRTNRCALVAAESRSCNEYACCSDTSVYYIDGSSCSTSCGGGTYNRVAYSSHNNQRCPSYDQSSGGGACNTQSCCSQTSIAGYGEYSACNATCGPGKMYRDIYLVSAYNPSISCGIADYQDEAPCDAGSCVHEHNYGWNYNGYDRSIAIHENYFCSVISYHSSWSNCTHANSGGAGIGKHDVPPGSTLCYGRCILCDQAAGWTWCPAAYTFRNGGNDFIPD